MYTQCSKCKSVFRVSETQLSARNGLVRCGQCHEVFNASWNLVDEVPTVVTRQRANQERLAAGVVAPGASTVDDGAPTPGHGAGGEQGELFGGDAAVRGRSQVQRRKRGAGPGGESELLPSAMPFAIVEDDSPPAALEPRSAGRGEPPLAEAAAEPVDGGEESVAATPPEAVADWPEAGAIDGGVRAEVQGEKPLELADRETDTKSAGADVLETVEPVPATSEPRPDRSLEGEAADEVPGTDVEHVAMDLPPSPAAAQQADEEPPVTPGLSASPDEKRPALSLEPAEVDEVGESAEGGAAEPSLADLFAAAEEQAEERLGDQDESAIHKEALASAPMGDLFALADETPSREPGATALGGEVNTEPASPVVPEAGETATGAPEQAEPKLPFDTPDAEEIVIEAPAMLWDAFRDEAPVGSGAHDQDRLDEQEAKAEDAAAMAARPGAATAPAGSRLGPPQPGPGAGAQSPSQQSATAALGARLRQSRDMKLVHLPRRQPLKTAVWIVAAVVLMVVGLWQVKAYYIGSLSQVAALRPYVAALCDVLSCAVPPRSAFNLIDLVGTSVNTHPETPGALRVSVNLVNRAEFEQAYPPLEITLSDKSGRIVGRRTYLPEDYLTDPASLLVPKVIQEVDIDLAQPSENAVGYEIQLVAR